MTSINKTLSKNLAIVKKQLTEPSKFRQTDYSGKACFSQACMKYGYVDTWDIALNLLNNLPENENIFNELIMDTSKVKPYLDVEWTTQCFPEYNKDDVKIKLRKSIIYIFKKEFNKVLKVDDIYFTSCHRKKGDTFKYSFHVVVSTHSPMLVFKNTNYASYLAFKIRGVMNKYIDDNYELIDVGKNDYLNCKFDGSVIDTAVYKKTQNIRLPGHCKKDEGVMYPFLIEENTDILQYIITNIDTTYEFLEVPEQRDFLYKNIKNLKKLDFMDNTDDQMIIFEKIKTVHPTAYFEKTDTQGFLQFNYKDRAEPCFIHDSKDVFHDKIGFFAYIYNNLICLGCHSGNCVDEKNDKRKKILGSLNVRKNLTYEKVEFSNEFDDIDHVFVKDCIMNGALGLSNLFEKMYLEPKRIKWVNDTKMGTSYFWDGKLWQEDDYSFIERLLVTTCVKVIRNFIDNYKNNSEIANEETENILEVANKMIVKLNDGILINNTLRFIKPLIRDINFSKIKNVHPHFLSCKNGMVDLTTGDLRPSTPEDNITQSLETVYDINADCLDFDSFIKQITSDEQGEIPELYDFFRWCIGYAIQGNPRKKLFLILYGPHGFNGKSLVMNTIKDILENYAVAMDNSVVLDNGSKKTAGSHSSELIQLENCRLGLLSDTKEDANIDDGRMKQLTGITDKISAREIFGKQKEFTPSFVPFISTNYPIQVNLSDQAMYERLILFPFVLSFVDEPKKKYERKADSSLADKFKNNKEGILKWIIDASVYYNENQDKLPPKIILKAKEKYNKQVNTYLDFLDTNFTTTESEEDTVNKTELIECYKNYMFQNGMGNKCKPIVAKREFDKILKLTTDKKYYLCIKFKNDDIVENDILS